MRICFDIDGTICELKNYIGSYEKVQPLPGIIKLMHKLKSEGHVIILYTARHMKTCQGNTGLVVAKQGRTLLDWLKKYEVPYDELYFGKPYADIYIDDNCLRFEGNWTQFSDVDLTNWISAEDSFGLNIVITMAGAGSRFAKRGYKLPKPLIPVNGMPMYRYSTNSLPLHLAKRLIFVIQENEYTKVLQKDIEENYALYSPKIVTIEKLTRGQAETLLLASEAMNHSIPTLVHNSDSAIEVDVDELTGIFRESDGALLTFEVENSNRYSFAHVTKDGLVDEVREKVQISTHASTGTYYFKSTVQLLNLIKTAIELNEKEQEEFYIAPLYNRMIQAQQVVKIVPVRNYYCYGTPEEYQDFVCSGKA